MSGNARDEALAHFGIKGMKWGVRRDNTGGGGSAGGGSSAPVAKKTRSAASEATGSLTNREKAARVGRSSVPILKTAGKAAGRVAAVAALTALGVPAVVAAGTVAATIAAHPELIRAGKEASQLWLNDAGLRDMSTMDQLKARYDLKTNFSETTTSR